MNIILTEGQARRVGYPADVIASAKKDPKGVLIQTPGEYCMLPEAYLSKMLMTTNKLPPVPEVPNRSQRRFLDRKNPACKNCSIHWLDRFDQWSSCTVRQPSDMPGAPGHRFL